MSTIVIPRTFSYQSYFDSTLLQRAILTQSPGSPIVDSTAERQSVSGYALGLHPSSQTPVAVEFSGGGRGGDRLTFFLKPGQVIRPLGNDPFTGFRWGLPYGWLGGGVAQLLVFQNPHTHVDWPTFKEVVFHRVRILIVADGGAAVTLLNNWPNRFPWPNALRGTDSINQGGSPIFHVKPTRTILRLRATGALAVTSFMRALIMDSDDLDRSSTDTFGTPGAAATFGEVTWPSVVNSGVTVGGVATIEMPSTVLDDTSPLTALGGDQCKVVFVSISGAATINGLYVDVERFGTL